jgi:hypothetical protein
VQEHIVEILAARDGADLANLGEYVPPRSKEGGARAARMHSS